MARYASDYLPKLGHDSHHARSLLEVIDNRLKAVSCLALKTTSNQFFPPLATR